MRLVSAVVAVLVPCASVDALAAESAPTLSVVGEPKPVGADTLRAKEVRNLPGAFGDPFRAIESMPGVIPIFSGVPYFYVRGAPPGNTGYFLDGVRVPLLFHLGAGPSVLAPGLIDRVDFHPSAAPASLGRFAGGFVSGTTRAPSVTPRLYGNFRLVDAGVMAETPFNNGRGDVLVAGRYGNATPILSLVDSNVGLTYGDYQLRIGHALSDRDRVSVFAFGAADAMTDRAAGTDIFSPSFHRLDLRWDRDLGGGGRLRFATTLMSDATTSTDSLDSRTTRSTAAMNGIGTRLELALPLSDRAYLRAGADAWWEVYRLDNEPADLVGTPVPIQYGATSSRRSDRLAGLRADIVLRPFRGLELVPGVRIDNYASTMLEHTSLVAPPPPASNTLAVDPRLATKVALHRDLRWISGFAIAHQGTQFAAPLPGGSLPSFDPRLQESFQMTQGFELDLPAKIALSITGFRATTLHPRDVIAACSEEGPVSSNAQYVPQLGEPCKLASGPPSRAYGLEILLRRDLSKRVGGFLAYTLSRSEVDLPYRKSVPTTHDRTHVLSAVGSVDLGRGFRFGARFAFMTGRPDGDRRLPPFYRFDVRFEKRWIIGEERSVAVIAEVLNATLQKEPTGYTNCSQQCELKTIGPVTIPTLGLEVYL